MRRFIWVLFVIVFLWSATPALAEDVHGIPQNPLSLKFDTAIWAVVIFVGLLIILRAKAWGPILEGLKKREETIHSSLEEAKKTRSEMEKMRLEFQQELARAHQQIPALMEDARKKAEAMSTEMLAKASTQTQSDRERMRRELEIAKDQALKELWDYAVQLATLISTKAIGRALSPEDHRRLAAESLQEMTKSSHN
jgi:F-type H+-transporting ATPase subunit b